MEQQRITTETLHESPAQLLEQYYIAIMTRNEARLRSHPLHASPYPLERRFGIIQGEQQGYFCVGSVNVDHEKASVTVLAENPQQGPIELRLSITNQQPDFLIYEREA